MKKILALATAVALSSGAALAADFQSGAPYTAPGSFGMYSWMGPYIGGNLGYQWGRTTNNPSDPSGIIGGLQAGYNWQSGQFVLGAEADFQLSDASDMFAPWKFSNPWFGTLRGRAGYAMNNILLYATIGLAYGRIRGETTAGMTESKTHGGWTGGLGLEVGLTPQWSARAEYLYIDLNDRTYTITGAANGLESNILRFGVNYRF